MTKHLSIILSVILILALCLSLAACGEKKDDGKSEEKATEAVTEKPTDPPTEAPTEPPTEAWDPVKDGYRIGDGVLKLAEITDDFEKYAKDEKYLDPDDNWVIVVFDVIDGHMNGLLSFIDNNIEVEDCTKVADKRSSKDGVYNGQVIVFYVAPDDYEFSPDKVHITEPELE